MALDTLTRNGLAVKDIHFAQIEKSRDGAGGGWFLRSFEVRLNGRVIASRTVNRWLEDDHRTARAEVARDHRASDIVPVWLRLDEDDYLYGFDDDGDINRYDRNTAVAFGYVPGAPLPREDTGDDRLSGRLSMGNGEKGQIRTLTSTITVLAPPRPAPFEPPVVQPLPPDPGPQPQPQPPPPPPTGTPDLVITSFTSVSLTVKNQGDAAAGPFNVTATAYPPIRVAGLAVADSGSEVAESDETNNTADAQQIC